jgi:hypothetical protein
MMSLTDWANRWGLPVQALVELAGIPAFTPVSPPPDIHSESAVQSLVQLEASRKGKYLWRNNVGALVDEKGRVVRYGLANRSKQENEVLKSGDLVGIEKVLITPAMVGHIIGRFVSCECKPVGWKFTGTPRELAQLRWISLINANGGRAAFVNSEGFL